MSTIRNERVKLEGNGGDWLIREAVSVTEALNAIAYARVTGSVGSRHEVNGKCVADVARLNPDGSVRRPG